MRQLVWFRTDLRVRDNTALHAAMDAGQTIAVFFITPNQWAEHNDAACKVDFWLRNVKALKNELDKLCVPLLIREVHTWKEIPEAISQLCAEHAIHAVHINEEYGINEKKRDDLTGQRLKQKQIPCYRYLDRLLFQPGSVLTRTGGYFKVFTQFKKTCHQQLSEILPKLQGIPLAQAPSSIPSDPVPTHTAGFPTPCKTLQELWPAGESAALDRLHNFSNYHLLHYDQRRDFPALAGTSQLSAYLAAGVLSPRQCFYVAIQKNQERFSSGNSGVVTWITELLWREFYTHVLVGFPHVSKHQPFRLQTDAIAWREAPADLLAWQKGRTGFPLIDAAMRQLLSTGWMHNRLRMVVAMFLSKNLLIDWRLGERFFMQHLIDGDLAANNGGWQWSASTGTDAVPWFRLFNPITQSERFDPEGKFIRHWLPELRHLDNHSIHQPQSIGSLFQDQAYPAPIVDLASSRERALTAFKTIQ